MTMKFKFQHELVDGQQVYRLISVKCLPGLKLPPKYFIGSGAKVFANTLPAGVNYGTDVIKSIFIGDLITDEELMEFNDVVEMAGIRLAEINERLEYLKGWANGYTTVQF